MSTPVADRLEPLWRRWRGLPVLVRDATPVLIACALVFQPRLADAGARIGELPRRPESFLGLLVTGALWVPLVARRRQPAISLTLIGAAFAAHELLAYPDTMATIGLYLALYSTGAHQRRGRRKLAGAATIAYVVLVLALVAEESPTTVTEFLAFYLFLAACWCAGAWVRARQLSEETRRQLSVEAAMTQERARIARELHDIVTHHVTAMVVQADATQFVLGDSSSRAATGLSAISDTGRRALTDLRNLLGVLTTVDDPPAGEQAQRSPAVARISDLVEQTRLTGQPVDLIEDGEPPVTVGGTQVAAYRVVQEALTNALKHAPGRQTSVRIRYRPGTTEIEVVTAGPENAPVRALPVKGPVKGGHGLTGMRQRIAVFGGDLLTGSTPDGGFLIRATVPEENTK